MKKFVAHLPAIVHGSASFISRPIAMMGLVFAEHHSDVRHAQSLKLAVPSALTVGPAIFKRNNVWVSCRALAHSKPHVR